MQYTSLVSQHPNNSSDTALGVVVLKGTYYYRWSTPGQVKERRLASNKVVFDEKKIVEEEINKLIEATQAYKGFCSKCHREIRIEYAGDGYADKGKSGRKLEREEIERLIEDATLAHFQIVFTPYSSRLGRNTSVSGTIRNKLKEHGVQIYSIHQPISIRCPTCFDPLDDDSAVITETISDLQAQLELSQIRRNYKNGMPVRIKDGKPAGSLAYGLVKRFRKCGVDARGNEIIEVYYEWENQKITYIKRITKEFLNGIGVWKICQQLNEEGVPSSHGKEWMRSAVYHILKNPVYAGYNRFGWKPVKNGRRIIQSKETWMLEKADFNGIWSYDYYLKIQVELERRRTIGGRAVASDGLLIGILKCADCRYSMFQNKDKKNRSDGKIYIYKGYGCGSYMHHGTCKANGVKQDILDELVINEVLKLANEKCREAFYKKFSDSKQASYFEILKTREKALSNAQLALKRANKAYLKGVDTLEEYNKLKSEIIQQIESFNSDIKDLQSKIRIPTKIKWSKAYETALEKFKDIETPQNKRQVKSILCKLIDRVEFRKKPFHVKIHYRLS